MHLKRIAVIAAGAGALMLAANGGLRAQDSPNFPLDGGTLLSDAAPTGAGGDVYLAFLKSSAAFTDNMSYWVWSSSTWSQVFVTQTATFGDVIDLGYYDVGQAIYLQLVANSIPGLPCDGPAGTVPGSCTWYNGDNSVPQFTNSDGAIHAENATWSCNVATAPGGDCSWADGFNMQIGFEDIIIGPGGYTNNYYQDYNDAILALKITSANTVPEPASMVLLATGLLGLAGIATARRRRKTVV